MDKDLFLQKVLDAEATLFHISFSILHNEQDCADAVQEAILKAYDARGSLKDERFFKTWIVRIVINECYALLRKANRFAPYAETFPPDTEASEQMEKYINEEYQNLYRAVAKLDEKLRICVVLFYFEDYSVSEIAKIVHIPTGTVKSRLNRARRLLKDLLNNQEEAI